MVLLFNIFSWLSLKNRDVIDTYFEILLLTENILSSYDQLFCVSVWLKGILLTITKEV